MLISEVPDHPGYFVDSNGTVYSQWVNRGQHGTIRGSLLRPLSTSKSKRGHLGIRFGRQGKSEWVHRLVYRVFKGDIPDGMLICHRDGNPSNNDLSNLYVGTQQDNMKDTVKYGTCALAKLTESDVKEIIALRHKMMVKDIAFKFKVNRHTIQDIYRGKTWTHITRKVAE